MAFMRDRKGRFEVMLKTINIKESTSQPIGLQLLFEPPNRVRFCYQFSGQLLIVGKARRNELGQASSLKETARHTRRECLAGIGDDGQARPQCISSCRMGGIREGVEEQVCTALPSQVRVAADPRGKDQT